MEYIIDLAGTFVELRGLTQAMMDMCDRLEWVHGLIDFLAEGMHRVIRSLEEQCLLGLNHREEYVGSGGMGYTDELPADDYDGKLVRPKDMWGFSTAQGFSDVSPAMHDEFILAHKKPLLDLFGVNCYGCCEPLHGKLDIVLEIPRIRRISISPWADVPTSAERLGSDYIFSWKPNAARLVGVRFDGELIRTEIEQTIDVCRGNGCRMEIVLKDTHTCNDEPRRFDDWSRIVSGMAGNV